MQLAAATSIKAPSLAVAERFADHFTALGVDQVATTSPDTLTLTFDQQSGYEFAIARAAVKDAVDGVKLVLQTAPGTPVPRLLPNLGHVLPTLQKLPGVDHIVGAETSPVQVTVFATDRPAASALSALLRDRLPDGTSIGVSVANVAPNE